MIFHILISLGNYFFENESGYFPGYINIFAGSPPERKSFLRCDETLRPMGTYPFACQYYFIEKNKYQWTRILHKSQVIKEAREKEVVGS